MESLKRVVMAKEKQSIAIPKRKMAKKNKTTLRALSIMAMFDRVISNAVNKQLRNWMATNESA